jgi:MoaA/NifB/PqqE/SkfB family radical SAM enzyme
MSTELLNFTHKMLQPNILPRIDEYIEKRQTSGPLIIELDPTTACNFQCPECINADLLNKGSIEDERLMKLMDEFHDVGVKGVIFIGGGEPLAHKLMPEPIIKAHELGISIGLTTNGSLINRYTDEIAECVQWTRVSVDAGTEETFSKFRPSHIFNSFSRITTNIEALAKVKKGILGYSFLLIERNLPNTQPETNVNELFVAAKLARDLGCDYFEYKPSVDAHHNLIPLSEYAKSEIARQTRLLEALNTNEFQVISPKSTDYLLTNKFLDQPKDYQTCPSVELRTVVTPKGIYPCPYKRGHEDEKIGTIDTNFKEYWNSTARAEKAKSINPNKSCPFYCIRHESNLLLHLLANGHEQGIDLLPYMIQTPQTNDVFI